MNDYLYSVILAGVPLRLAAGQPIPPFDSFRTEDGSGPVVEAQKETDGGTRKLFPEDAKPETREYISFIPAVSHALLPYHRCLFHGTAFLWREKAWIFTAPPGTGKTTQYIRWKMRYGDEVTILNGDKPILEWCGDGGVRVHPSPWRGKENMGQMVSAPLGGIIYLRQGRENRIDCLMNGGKTAELLYRQFLFEPKNREDALLVCDLTERLIRSVPVWMLTNLGDDASAVLMHDAILKWEKTK